MTGYYLYCMTRPDNAPGPTLAGIFDAGVQSLAVAGLAVWAQPAEGRPDPTLDAIRTHHEVVDAAAAGGPVLPLRFGQWVEDLDAVKETLERRRDDYRDAMDRVEGAVEVGIRIMDPDATPLPAPPTAAAREGGGGDAPAPGSGRAYLEALRAREQARTERVRRGRELAAELSAGLGRLVRAERVGEPSAEGDLATVAHLVARPDLERHGDAVRAFGERHPGLRILRSGPWPPYSFTPGAPEEAEPAAGPGDGAR